MLYDSVQNALICAFSFARTMLVLLLMVGAGTAAAYCPTAQVSCHMTEGAEPDAENAVCVLACGVAFETKGETVANQQAAFSFNRDFHSFSLRGHDTEPDLPPPRISI